MYMYNFKKLIATYSINTLSLLLLFQVSRKGSVNLNVVISWQIKKIKSKKQSSLTHSGIISILLI